MVAEPARTLGLKHCLEALGRWKGGVDATVESCFRRNGFSVPRDADRMPWTSSGEFLISDLVIDIMRRLAPRSATRVLDPAASFGFLLSAFMESDVATSGRGFTRGGVAHAFGQPLADAFGFTLSDEEVTGWLETTTEQFDLVVSSLPWGLRPEARTFLVDSVPVECRDEYGHILLAAASLRLADDGIGLFVVPPSFVTRRDARTVSHQLVALGLHLDGLLYLPPRSFEPSALIRGAIAVIRRGSANTLFVGEVSDAPERLDALLANLAARRDGADVGLGRVVAASTFRGIDALVAADRETSLAQKLGPSWRKVRLGDLLTNITLVATGGEHTEAPNAVYLPLIGESPAFTSIGDLRIKPQNYAQIHIRPDAIEPTFLARFLGTPLGRLARSQNLSGGTIPKLSKGTIPNIEVYVPPLTFQRQMIDTATQLDQVTSDLVERTDRLWSDPASLEETSIALQRLTRHQEMSFKDWIDRLPFPLASILWAYHAVGDDPKSRYEHLVHFFEAAAEFHAVILLSAARRAGMLASEPFKRELAAALKGSSLRRATFGTWLSILGFAAKHFRKLLNGGEELWQQAVDGLCSRDAVVLRMLTSSDLVSVLQKANALRNAWVGHTGIVSPEGARERERTLAELLTRFRTIYGTAWDQLDLILPGPSRVRQGVFHCTARRVMGRSTPFEERIVEAEHHLEDGRLYLVASGERRLLELLPFVVVGTSPDVAQNACYFYNREQADGLKFVSYHFEHAAERIEQNSDISALIDELSLSAA